MPEYDEDFDPDDCDPEWYDEEEPEVEPLELQPGAIVKHCGEDWTCLGHYMWEGNPTYFLADANGNQIEGWYISDRPEGYRFDQV